LQDVRIPSIHHIENSFLPYFIFLVFNAV